MRSLSLTTSDKKPWSAFGYSWGDKAAIDKEDRRLAFERSEAISPELLDVTATEAIGRDDGRTLRMLLSNADKGGNVSTNLLQKAWIYSISTREGLDMETGTMVLQLALRGDGEMTVSAEEGHCQDILNSLIRQCKWFQAAVVAEFMIRNDMKFSGDRELFFITAGLMKSETGTARTLQLLTEVVKHKRSDLDTLFNYTKVTRLSLSLHDTTHGSSAKGSAAFKLGEGPLQDLSEALLANMSAEVPWYSFSGSKMFVALACASKQYDIAIDFMERSIDIGTEAQRAGHPLHGRLDVLDMLRSFSQGAGKASKDPKGFKDGDRDKSCLVSLRLLDLAVSYLKEDKFAAASILSSPLKGVEFLKMYWVLALRAEKAPLLATVEDFQADDGDATSASTSSALAAESISDSYPRQHYHKVKEDTGPSSESEGTVTRRIRHDPVLASSYNQLVSFMKDEAAEQMTSSPAPGSHRRAFRYLCDTLGLRHKVVQLISEKGGGVGDTYGVKVWKQDLRRMGIQPPSLADILLSDLKKGPQARRLTPPPRHWDVISAALLDNAAVKDLRSIATMTTLGMHRSYPSNEWGLLFLDLLRDAEGAVSSSTGLLRNLIDMGARRNDIYGILEILYANEEAAYQYPTSDAQQSELLARVAEEQDDAATAAEKARRAFYAAFDDPEEARAAERTLELAASGSSGVPIATIWDSPAAFRLPVPSSLTSAPNSQNTAIKGPLRQRDWNQACRAAYHSRLSEMSSSSFREAFTEVIHLMREAQVDLDESLMRTLLRFLIYTGQDTDLTQRILRRLARDKTIQVSHIECISLTSVMLRRVPDLQQGEGRLFLARPLYKSPNYLFVYPTALSYMFDSVLKNAEFLGPDFLVEFEQAWKETHALEGRKRLWQLLNGVLKDEKQGGRRQELIMANDDAQRCVVMLSIYSSYLVGANGINRDDMRTGNGSFRQAYDLLYSAETMMQEAENLIESREGRTDNDYE